MALFDQEAVKDRLFLGLFPDDATRALIAAAAEKIRPQLRGQGQGIRASQYHATLHHLGDYPELPPDRVDASIAAIARAATTTFELVFDRIDSFRGQRKHPCVLRCSQVSPALQAYWRETKVLLAAAGFSPWLKSSLVPHVTLYYADNVLPEAVSIEPIILPVRELLLVHSLLGRTEYRVVGRKSFQNL